MNKTTHLPLKDSEVAVHSLVALSCWRLARLTCQSPSRSLRGSKVRSRWDSADRHRQAHIGTRRSRCRPLGNLGEWIFLNCLARPAEATSPA